MFCAFPRFASRVTLTVLSSTATEGQHATVHARSSQGVKQYTLGNRLSCLIVKFGEYSVAGFGCGLLGQGIANALMVAK